MKTTIALDNLRALVIEPERGGVKLSIRVGSIVVGTMNLDKKAVVAVVSGIEHACGAPQPLL